MIDEQRGAPGEILPATPDNLERVAKRWEGLLERLDAKMKNIQGLDRTPEERLIAQAAKSPTSAKRVSWLRKAADHVSDSAAHLAACKKGCAHCCHIAVMISRSEAQVIAKETGAKLDVKAGAFTMDHAEDAPGAYQAATDQAFGRPCPFLADGSCSIYSSRPLQCRLLLNLDDDALLCQLMQGGATNVPYLNTKIHHFAAVTILGAHQDYDDIRHWFPQGLK